MKSLFVDLVPHASLGASEGGMDVSTNRSDADGDGGEAEGEGICARVAALYRGKGPLER